MDALFADLVVFVGSYISGPGYLAGSIPPDPNPDNLDGRTKVLGEIKPLRVTVLDGVTKRAVAQTFSAADGTWRIDGLKLNHRFAVSAFGHDPSRWPLGRR